MKDAIKTFIYSSRHLGGIGIGLGFTCIEYHFGELREDEIFVRSFNGTGVCVDPCESQVRTYTRSIWIY